MGQRVKLGDDPHGKGISLDLDAVLRTRLLIQANSGGGKSWLLRRLAEQLFGKLPVLLIDPEGEFATLRERYGYVLVGKGGETPADVRSAALVAHRLLELRASAVCDLFEMKPPDRHEWVRRFLEALIDAPKKLWQPLVVIVDEAHLFAPERGAGESVASSAMVDLAGRGRKRGFAAIMATQRLGKLRKDVAAELLNVLIGHTFIDIDRERAADALGVPKGKVRDDFYDQIKLLGEGQFFGLGRAIALERVLVKVGPVTTTHPEPGSTKHAAAPPPAPDKVRALLPKLADLPAEAEQRERTTDELRRENAALKRELAAEKRKAPAMSAAIVATTKTIEVPALTAKDRAAIEKAAGRFETAAAHLHAVAERTTEAAGGTLQRAFEQLSSVRDDARRYAVGAAEQAGELRKLLTAKIAPAPRGPVLPAGPRTPSPTPAQRMASTARPASAAVSTTREGPGERILRSLAWWRASGNTKPSRAQVAFMARYTVNGHFNNEVGGLRADGLIEYPEGNRIALTEAGIATAPTVDDAPITRDEMIARVRAVLRTEPRIRIFDALVAGGGRLPREDLAAGARYTVNGHFNNEVGALKSIEVVTYPSRGEVALGEMFEGLS